LSGEHIRGFGIEQCGEIVSLFAFAKMSLPRTATLEGMGAVLEICSISRTHPSVRNAAQPHAGTP
jgi:hypothetical protein